MYMFMNMFDIQYYYKRVVSYSYKYSDKLNS